MSHLLNLLEKENRNRSEETLVNIMYMEEEYVKSLIQATMPNIKIDQVKKVNNNFLECLYLLTKKEYAVRYKQCEELNLMHVTAQRNVSSIVSNNLDWRRVNRCSYGQGTYFSNDAKLANDICNPNCGSSRAIILCKVLVCNPCSHKVNLLPPSTYDTTTAYSGRVFVKFRDYEFLPMFVAFYQYQYF